MYVENEIRQGWAARRYRTSASVQRAGSNTASSAVLSQLLVRYSDASSVVVATGSAYAAVPWFQLRAT